MGDAEIFLASTTKHDNKSSLQIKHRVKALTRSLQLYI